MLHSFSSEQVSRLNARIFSGIEIYSWSQEDIPAIPFIPVDPRIEFVMLTNPLVRDNVRDRGDQALVTEGRQSMQGNPQFFVGTTMDRHWGTITGPVAASRTFSRSRLSPEHFANVAFSDDHKVSPLGPNKWSRQSDDTSAHLLEFQAPTHDNSGGRRRDRFVVSPSRVKVSCQCPPANLHLFHKRLRRSPVAAESLLERLASPLHPSLSTVSCPAVGDAYASCSARVALIVFGPRWIRRIEAQKAEIVGYFVNDIRGHPG